MRKLLLIILVFVMNLAPTVAVAQPTGSIRDSLPSDALKKKWDEGIDSFKDGTFDAALVEFQSVYDATKNPRILYNISVCHRKLSQFSQAITALERQLTFRDELSEKEVERAEKLLELLKPTVTPLEIKVDQEGAKVVLNGVELGETPLLGPVTAHVGNNQLVVTKPGFRTLDRKFQLPRGDKPRTLELKLEPETLTARVTVAVNGPPGAVIFIDGTEMGSSPYSGDLAVGRHTIEARAPGFVTARQTSVLKYGQPLRVTLTLTEAKKQGKLRVVTDHDDAVIVLDDKMVGTGAWEGVVSSGGHVLTVTKDGYLDYTTEVALDDDQERTLRVTLEDDPTSAYIFWSVSGVAVAAGIAVGAYFVFRPEATSPVDGTFDPGTVPTLFRF